MNFKRKKGVPSLFTVHRTTPIVVLLIDMLAGGNQ